MSLRQMFRPKLLSKNRNVTRGGGVPHNDPPEFKEITNKRYLGLHDHFLWFKDSHAQEYHVTLKHNMYRGVWATFYQLCVNYIGKVMVPLVFYFYLKGHAHDHKSYYRVEMPLLPGNPLYENNNSCGPKFFDNVREQLLNKPKDFLGRRGEDFYKPHKPAIPMPSELNCKEKQHLSLAKHLS